jgi:hypothetical protein
LLIPRNGQVMSSEISQHHADTIPGSPRPQEPPL